MSTSTPQAHHRQQRDSEEELHFRHAVEHRKRANELRSFRTEQLEYELQLRQAVCLCNRSLVKEQEEHSRLERRKNKIVQHRARLKALEEDRVQFLEKLQLEQQQLDRGKANDRRGQGKISSDGSGGGALPSLGRSRSGLSKLPPLVQTHNRQGAGPRSRSTNPPSPSPSPAPHGYAPSFSTRPPYQPTVHTVPWPRAGWCLLPD
jgi:hypothetical protein